MNRLLLTLDDIDSDESMKNLASLLGSSYHNSTIRIPEQLGQGMIMKTTLEKGLSMRIWDFKINKPFGFNKLADTKSIEKSFQVIYLLNPETISLKEPATSRFLRLQNGINTLFSSSDNAAEMDVDATKGLRAVDINFTASWLITTFQGADEQMSNFINDMLENNKPTALFESTSVVEYKTLSNIHTVGRQPIKDSLQLKAGALSLLATFFHTLSSKTFAELISKKHPHFDKMLEVEQLLKDHLQKKLPGIDTIARKVALSESTLKRHFKISFGKSVYDYYLELKMDFAKRIMMDKQLSVNEVATMLDYEKVSNFIGMFKKHHGFSPGEMRKNNLFG